MPVAAGTRIGPYEIVAWLGAGGMGVVYRAHDSRLGREVAIKLIPESVAADETRLRRFEQEARSAGQLNHPNIVAVHDIGVHSGTPYIVTELLEGESLRSRLDGGALPARKAVDYARQTAAGLAAAHDKGIVHRDVKPDNLFITTEGRIKILDFGIAKLTSAGGDGVHHTGLPTETAEGTVVGTAGYMSPEQVRGEPVDARSDIFSVGAVLHEMLTGRPAFTRDTAADTMAAILKEDPREHLPATVPPALERIVSRCLEKARETRYQSARDLAFGLEVLSDTGASAMPAATHAAALRWRSVAGYAVVALGVLGAMAIWITRQNAPPPVENPLANARFSRFTNWPGTEAGAAISPDGRFVAFVADRDGEFDLFLSQVGTGHYQNLTREIAPLSAPSILRTIGFSGDGADIWFTEGGDAGLPKWLIPLSGGTPRAFLGKGAAAPFWSPDDRHLAYFINNNGDPFYLADRTGGDARPLVVDTPGFFSNAAHSHNPVWSADGQWIYFVHGLTPNDLNVWRVRTVGGKPEQLTTLPGPVNYVAPIGPRTLLYTARAEDGLGPWLWSLDVETKATQRVTSGLDHFSSVSASLDGRRVVATAQNPTATLWSVPVLDRKAEESDVRPYPLTSARALAPRFGNGSLFYLSSSGSGDGLWLARDGQTSEIWKSADGSLTEPAAVSRDGSQVAIVVNQGGKQRLSVMAANGTNARTLAPAMEIRGSGGQGIADWSRDGDWIVAAGTDAQGPGLFRIPLDGGPPSRLASGLVVNPVCSPDGTLIVYGGPVVGGRVPLLGVRPDGTVVQLPNVLARLGGGHRFLPDGTLVYLPLGQTLNFWLLNLTTKETHQITNLSDRGTLGPFDISPDGKQIVFGRSRENSDIYLIEIPQK
jgi:Tol biopolymer transport system component